MEEGPDFPVDLENCITLDELEESDDSETAAEPKSSTTRVVFFKKLPPRFYTDAEFVQLVQGVGTPVRYFLIRRQQQGFIEMSSPAEALEAARVLNRRTFLGSRLFVNISHKYTRLVNGYDVQSDSDTEKSESRSSRRRDGLSKSRTSDREEACRGESGSRKTPERESGSRKTPERESGPRKTPERESGSRKTPESESASRKTPERESGPRKTPGSESASRKTPERESGPRKTPESESASRKTPESESGPRKTPESESASRKTPERESGPRKTPEIELFPKVGQEDKTLKGNVSDNESLPEKNLKSQNEREATEKDAPEKEPAMNPGETSESETSPDQPHTEQKPADSDHAVKLEQTPAGGVAEPENPTKPVGTEFVRPVVGYFCHLCHVIYADEDEAKVQHCSSRTHYRKYQVQTNQSGTRRVLN